jgi:hypothetical protein
LETSLEFMDEQRHVALPKLFGAPAYSRPPIVAANPVPRPIDPDDLPLVAQMTVDDLANLAVPASLDDQVTLEVQASLEVPATLESPAMPDTLETPAALASKAEQPGGSIDGATAAAPPADAFEPRPFSIRELADRIRGPRL